MITTTLISSCHWKTLVPFCLRKKRPENEFLTKQWIIAKSYLKTNYSIQNNSKLAIYWYMMLLSHWLFWLKNCHFSTVIRVYYTLTDIHDALLDYNNELHWLFWKLLFEGYVFPCSSDRFWSRYLTLEFPIMLVVDSRRLQSSS